MVDRTPDAALRQIGFREVASAALHARRIGPRLREPALVESAGKPEIIQRTPLSGQARANRIQGGSPECFRACRSTPWTGAV
jgi:hypothetical protein